MRVIKPHSPISWFAALNTSFKDQTLGSSVFRFQPEHPRTTYVGDEADDWPTLRFNTQPHMRGYFHATNKAIRLYRFITLT